MFTKDNCPLDWKKKKTASPPPPPPPQQKYSDLPSKRPPPIFFHLDQLSAVVFRCARNVCVCVSVCVCVFSNIFAETTGPTEAKFHVGPPWDRGRQFIQIVQVICCSSLLSTSRGGAGAFSRDFTIKLSPQCRAFSRALKTEKLKAPLFPGPVGAGTTNDWWLVRFHFVLDYSLSVYKVILVGVILETPHCKYLFQLVLF